MFSPKTLLRFYKGRIIYVIFLFNLYLQLILQLRTNSYLQMQPEQRAKSTLRGEGEGSARNKKQRYVKLQNINIIKMYNTVYKYNTITVKSVGRDK